MHTDQGLVGLGETSYAAQSVEAYLHEYVAPRVLGRDPLEIEALAREPHRLPRLSRLGRGDARGVGVRPRALGPVRQGVQPAALPGARRREPQRVRTYNTCAGYRYIRAAGGQSTKNWGLDGKPQGPYEDLDAFLHRADELAQSLLEQGITGMKIWPFDPHAEAIDGQYISGPDLERRSSRSGKSAKRSATAWTSWSSSTRCGACPRRSSIAQALAEFDTFWHEDPIRMDSLALLKQYAPHSKAPICASEILAGRWSFKDLLETGVAGIVMFDLAWCGGISEARRIAALADAWQLPVAPHDCTGPLVYAASVHFSIWAPNALIQESVRAFYTGWYNELVTHVPQPVQGYFGKPPGPGIGCELLPEVWKRKDAVVRVSQA